MSVSFVCAVSGSGPGAVVFCAPVGGSGSPLLSCLPSGVPLPSGVSASLSAVRSAFPGAFVFSGVLPSVRSVVLFGLSVFGVFSGVLCSCVGSCSCGSHVGSGSRLRAVVRGRPGSGGRPSSASRLVRLSSGSWVRVSPVLSQLSLF